MARKYTKRNSSYWENRRGHTEAPIEVATKRPALDFGWDGSEPFSAVAACGGGSSTSFRDSRAPSIVPLDRYKNINTGMLPWEEVGGYTSINGAVILCQRAYANVAIVRNTIESAVEFSNSKLHIKTPNKTVEQFFTEWFNRINIYKLKDMFFREYYRSGNVFMYKFNGRLKSDQYGKMQTVFGAKNDLLPIRYVILNPAQIYLNAGLGYNNNWAKLLSVYEIQMLREGRTPEDKQIYNSLPPDVKAAIRKGNYTDQIYMPLDPQRLYYAFYKKQDYEPLAIPMIYPVLNDIEWKLELKKMDMALSRTIEHVILLITHGEESKPGGLGGTDPENLKKLQAVFRNQSLGRVLVADYSTKGEWLIPDIGTILGPEKYEQVEADIKEGLQSILMGDGEKFANAQIKARVFIERMKEGQKVFLNNFLLPEIKLICEQMNFKNVPDIEFEEISLDDQTNLSRVYVRLAELGLLSPTETFTALQSGILPDPESNVINQESYKKLRDRGLYDPIIGGKKQEEGRPTGTKAPQTTKKISPIGTGAEDKFSTTAVGRLIILAEALKDQIAAKAKKKYKIKGSLTNEQMSLVETIAKTIVANEEEKNWTTSIDQYIKDPQPIKDEIAREMNEIAANYDTTDFQAAILTKARIR